MYRPAHDDEEEEFIYEPRDLVLLSERARKLLHYEWVRRQQAEELAFTA